MPDIEAPLDGSVEGPKSHAVDGSDQKYASPEPGINYLLEPSEADSATDKDFTNEKPQTFQMYSPLNGPSQDSLEQEVRESKLNQDLEWYKLRVKEQRTTIESMSEERRYWKDKMAEKEALHAKQLEQVMADHTAEMERAKLGFEEMKELYN